MWASLSRFWSLSRGLLVAGAAVGLAAFSPTQPQAVQGPCHVKGFFIVALGTSNTTMQTTNVEQACTFTLFNPDLQQFQTSALITRPPRHGQADAHLLQGGRMAMVAYTPSPGYIGHDQFTATTEPNDKAVIVHVVVIPDRSGGTPSP